MTESNDKRVGRPRNPRKTQAILDAGWSLFLEQGVHATSIEAIAAAANVSKVTLYRHFADRTALFEAAVLREMERIEQAQAQMPTDQSASTEESLRAFGLGIMTFLSSKPAIDFYSVVAGELRRHPELARSFYRLGPGRTHANLTALLDAAMQRGDLAPLDPHRAAEELFGLWQGFSNFQYALTIDLEALKADLPARVERGIGLFLRVYSVDRAT